MLRSTPPHGGFQKQTKSLLWIRFSLGFRRVTILDFWWPAVRTAAVSSSMLLGAVSWLLSLAAPACSWLLLGRSWLFLAAPGCSWLLLGATGCSRQFRLLLAAPGCSWLFLAVLLACSWLLLDVPGCSWLLLVAPGPSGTFLGSPLEVHLVAIYAGPALLGHSWDSLLQLILSLFT